MKFVIFGLSVSSSWGNGHATLWRGLCAALAKRGHRVVFFERDVPYYAATRDLFTLPEGHLLFYDNWEEAALIARKQLADADVAMVTSYCPDAVAASDLTSISRPRCGVFTIWIRPLRSTGLNAVSRLTILALVDCGTLI